MSSTSSADSPAGPAVRPASIAAAPVAGNSRKRAQPTSTPPLKSGAVKRRALDANSQAISEESAYIGSSAVAAAGEAQALSPALHSSIASSQHTEVYSLDIGDDDDDIGEGSEGSEVVLPGEPGGDDDFQRELHGCMRAAMAIKGAESKLRRANRTAEKQAENVRTRTAHLADARKVRHAATDAVIKATVIATKAEAADKKAKADLQREEAVMRALEQKKKKTDSISAAAHAEAARAAEQHRQAMARCSEMQKKLTSLNMALSSAATKFSDSAAAVAALSSASADGCAPAPAHFGPIAGIKSAFTAYERAVNEAAAVQKSFDEVKDQVSKAAHTETETRAAAKQAAEEAEEAAAQLDKFVARAVLSIAINSAKKAAKRMAEAHDVVKQAEAKVKVASAQTEQAEKELHKAQAEHKRTSGLCTTYKNFLAEQNACAAVLNFLHAIKCGDVDKVRRLASIVTVKAVRADAYWALRYAALRTEVSPDILRVVVHQVRDDSTMLGPGANFFASSSSSSQPLGEQSATQKADQRIMMEVQDMVQQQLVRYRCKLKAGPGTGAGSDDASMASTSQSITCLKAKLELLLADPQQLEQ